MKLLATLTSLFAFYITPVMFYVLACQCFSTLSYQKNNPQKNNIVLLALGVLLVATLLLLFVSRQSLGFTGKNYKIAAIADIILTTVAFAGSVFFRFLVGKRSVYYIINYTLIASFYLLAFTSKLISLLSRDGVELLR